MHPGPITGDPDPIEGSGHGSLVLLVILVVIGVLLIATIVAQFAGGYLADPARRTLPSGVAVVIEGDPS
jgi:hypothetical protein